MSKPAPPPTDDGQAEFVELQRKQWAALDRAVYFGMTPEESKVYDQRARRIVELQRALGTKLKIPPRER